jgi:pimeloyl-ACP methyl ester carboxylesterase
VRAGLAALAVLALGSGALMRDRLVDAMVFQPQKGQQVVPANLGIDAEAVWLEPEPGLRIHAFWLESPGATRALLFLHGNAGNASHRLPNAEALARLGTHVLLIDYRGYGLSEGSPSEAGIYADARAGLDHLLGPRGIGERRVVLFGRSLGGAVAVDLARGRELGGVVLESTFSSASDVARGLLGAPGAWLASGSYASDRKISQLRAPLLMFHGDRDRVIDIALGRKLFEAAPEPKAFERIMDAGHNDTVQVGGRAYFQRIGAFLDDVVPPSEASP